MLKMKYNNLKLKYMKRWSILYFDQKKQEWHRSYYYDLKSYSVALDGIEVDETKTDILTNFEEFPVETKPFLDMFV